MRENHHTESGRPTLMMTTPGITQKRLSALPLASEGEASVGPDSVNPWRSEREREIVEEIAQRREERRDDQLFKTARADGTDTGGVDHPLHENRTVDEAPFAWDTVEDDVFDLPALDSDDPFGVSVISPFSGEGPRF